jgi:hypothetical protein
MKTAILVPIAAAALSAYAEGPGEASPKHSGGGASASVLAQAPRDYATYNVCEAVPGDAIARAVGGKLVTTRPTFDKNWSRCLYMVTTPGSDRQRGYVVWLGPAADFEDMKPHIEEPITPVSGLGDGAYIYRDKGDGRFKIYVLMRGQQTFETTGEASESVRKVAEAVLAVLRNKPS